MLLLHHTLGPVYDGVSQFCFPLFLSAQYDACARSVLPKRRLVFPPVRVVSTDVNERKDGDRLHRLTPNLCVPVVFTFVHAVSNFV